MLKIITAYEYLIEPKNLIKQFKSKDEFKHWLSQGSKEDLQHALKAFEKSELYEYCAIIRDEIKAFKHV